MRASERFDAEPDARLEGLRAEGGYKSERVVTSMQAGVVALAGGQRVINLCANNYPGLADDPEVIAASRAGLDRYGFGMPSVRFICGTREEHRALEARLADFVGMQASILYAAAFDANAGLLEALLGLEDAIISDALDHVSIIDGVRLSKAQRYRDMADLERCLKEAHGARQDRIRTQMSAALGRDMLDRASDAFESVGRKLGVIE